MVRFLNNEELLEISTNKNVFGIPFKLNNEERVFNNNYDTLVITEDDNQKVNKILLPMIKNISNTNESLFVNDVKGILYDKTNEILKEKGYKTILIDLENTNNSECFNPFELAINSYKTNKDLAINLIEKIASCIFITEPNTDPFWANSASKLFIGTALYLLDNNIELNFINIKKYVDKINIKEIDDNSMIYTFLSITLNAPSDTKNSIISVFLDFISNFNTKEGLIKILSSTSFDINNLEKSAIFVKNDLNDLSSMIIPMMIQNIFYSLKNKDIKFNFLLDNFNNLKKIKDFVKIMTYSDNLNFTLFINSFKGLKNTYGIENAETIKGFSRNMLYLFSNDIDTLNEISKLTGNIVSIEELSRFNDDEAILLMMRKMPIKINLI